VSCGGGSDAGTGSVGGDHRLIAAIGDSITAGYPGYTPNPARFRRLGLHRNPMSQWEYWAQQQHPELEFRNCGVPGERTDQIARRFDQCTQGVDGVVIQGGINDLIDAIPSAVVLANLRRMVDRARQLNLDVAVADLLPYGRAPQSDPAIDRLNLQIAAMARREEATFLDFHRVLEDPQHPGQMRPAWTADAIHPTVEGYRRRGELAFKPPGE
jgi:lysophospholipase L1-like esterase